MDTTDVEMNFPDKRILVYDFGPIKERLQRPGKFCYKNGVHIYLWLYVFGFIVALVYCAVTYLPK